MAGKRGAGLRRDSNRARSDQIYPVLATEGRKAVMSNQKSKPVRAAHPHLRVVGAVASASVALDFDALFRRYSPYVASIGLRLLGRDDELDDLVQDVFLEAHRGLPRLPRPARSRAGWRASASGAQCVVCVGAGCARF